MKIQKPDYSDLRIKYAQDSDVMILLDTIEAQHDVLETNRIRLEQWESFGVEIKQKLDAIDAEHASLEATGRCPTCGQVRPPSPDKSSMN